MCVLLALKEEDTAAQSYSAPHGPADCRRPEAIGIASSSSTQKTL